MIVGSSPRIEECELLDLSGENQACPSISDIPIKYNAFGTFVGDKAIVCGGYAGTGADRYSNKCYAYNMQVSHILIIQGEIMKFLPKTKKALNLSQESCF